MFDIVSLEKEAYRGHVTRCEYVTTGHYRVAASAAGDGFVFQLMPEAFAAPVKKAFDMHLYPDYFENAEAYGVFVKDILIAVIEINHETWNNRLRITDIWVLDAWRGHGLGKELMNLAKQRARMLGCRMIVLETQSCNLLAIGFYQKQGFAFIGIDTACYSNDDIAKEEVRIEMGYQLKEGNGS
ncbi:MAG: GNAT family N-acetyltransferase [bacterium]